MAHNVGVKNLGLVFERKCNPCAEGNNLPIVQAHIHFGNFGYTQITQRSGRTMKTQPSGTREIPLIFKPGGKRLNVGRASDNELMLNDASVSKIHGALLMTSEGTLLVADTGSTNGTYINGRRIAYGESRLIEDGDVVGFGDVEVRLRKTE